MIKTLQRRFALSRQGAVDLIKGCIACVVQDISFMLPVGLLYYFVIDTMNGNLNGSRIAFYAVGSLVCLCLIFIATWFQYNATYLATYVESGVRRISLAERLRKIPLSFFGKKDLADLTNSIMGDCATLETAFSHYVPALAGSLISTLQDGEIVESGTHSGLIERNGIFTKMWKDYSEAAEWKIAKEVNA